MKIAILSLDPNLYSTRRLKDSGEKRGHQMRVINYMCCYLNITADKPMVMYQGKPLDDFDAIIPRIGASQTFYGTAVVRQFEVMGVKSANPTQGISRSRDKLRSLQILSGENIGLPVTGFAYLTEDIDHLIEMVGGAPLVIKLLEGSQGIGVVLAETHQAAKSVIEAFRGLQANILVQEFIKEAGGMDIRCLVINSKVVASIKRQGAEGEFRSNLHRGGTAEKIQLTSQELTTAIRAAKAMGLPIAGVDMVRSHRGPLVLEVNSSPGLEGIEKATGVDVAGKIIEFLEKSAANQKKGAPGSGAVRDRIKY